MGISELVPRGMPQADFLLRSGAAQPDRSPLLLALPRPSSQWTGKHLCKFLDNRLRFFLAMDCNGE
jgi:hypothetical protein